MDAQSIIQRILKGHLVAGKIYPHPLPDNLKRWYCYTADGGHCIVAVVKSLYGSSKDVDQFLVPVPIKSVLRDYEERDGYIVVDLPYDSTLGLIVPEGDDEF